MLKEQKLLINHHLNVSGYIAWLGLFVVFMNKKIEKNSINSLNLEMHHYLQFLQPRWPQRKKQSSIIWLMKLLEDGNFGKLSLGSHQKDYCSLNC